MEIKYEDFIQPSNRDTCFFELFSFYKWSPDMIKRALEIAKENSFEAQSGRSVGQIEEGKHRRSGKSGQWRSEFSAKVNDVFNKLYYNLLTKLGYETENSAYTQVDFKDQVLVANKLDEERGPRR